MTPHAFGIDVGGSGVKGAPVDCDTGECTADRVRIATPQPSTPKAVGKVIAQVIEQFGDAVDGLPIGITAPTIVTHGVTRSAANVDKKWIDAPVEEMFSDALGRPVVVLNDADAAGFAEVYYGAARNQDGLVIVTTLGTGIGSALIYRGVLIPNAELGHLEIDGFDAEKRAAASARVKEDLSWKVYTKRLQQYYSKLEFLFSPDLFVVGGGISRMSDKFLPYLELRTPIVAAQLFNQAGIVGAARYAWDQARAAQNAG